MDPNTPDPSTAAERDASLTAADDASPDVVDDGSANATDPVGDPEWRRITSYDPSLAGPDEHPEETDAGGLHGVQGFSLTDYSRDAADKGWGPGWPTNRAGDMARVTADRSGTGVNVHKRVARLVDLLMDATEARGYLLRQRDTGAFNCRPIAGTSVPSNHSWGLACDLNWTSNPVSHDGRAHTDFPSWLVPMWSRYGFAWGGNYRGDYRDAMHLEFMGTPAEADALTVKAKRELAPIIAEDELPEAKDVWAYGVQNPKSKMVMPAGERLVDVEATAAAVRSDVAALKALVAREAVNDAARDAALATAVQKLSDAGGAAVDLDALRAAMVSAAEEGSASALSRLDVILRDPDPEPAPTA